MEALSVTANIIAVLHAVNTIIDICCDYSAAIRGASWELPKVTKELQSLRDVLELLKGLAKRVENADPSADARLPALIRICNSDAGPLGMCNNELRFLERRLEPPKWTGPATSKRTALMQTLSWPLKEGETKKILQNIERYKTNLSMALEIDQTAISLETNEMARVIQAKTSEMSEDFAELKLSFSMAKLDDKLREWLSAPDPSSNHNEACYKRQATTGDWFIQSSNFTKWKDDKHSLLWLHGIPGCGKTILCSTVIETVLLESRPAVNKAVAYFYFDFRTTERQYEGMLRSLISQLATKCTNHLNPLKSLYSSCGDGDRQPRISELKHTLQDLVRSFDDTFVILDALDEVKQREDLLDDIQEIIEWQLGSLHILVTSRREWDIKQTLDPLLNENQNIDIQSEVVDRDIRVYVHRILQTAKGLNRWRNKPLVQDEIEKALTENANGMFRWVVCQLDELKKCLNLPMLRKQLKCLPATLPQTYERILLNIDESYSQYILKILPWLTYSKRALSLLELAEVVAIDEDEDPRFDPERRFPEPEEILLICSSLVTTMEEKHGKKTVRLAHFSVKEYLVSSQIMSGEASKYSIQEIHANFCIAKDCLSYILYFTEDIPKPAKREEYNKFWRAYPLARYALREWSTHAGVGGRINEELTVDLIMRLFTPEKDSLRTWLFLDENGYMRSQPHGLPLYYVSGKGFLRVARRLITMGADVDARSGDYGTALCVASAEGHTEIVKLLLEMGADPNPLERGSKGGSALYWASERRYDAIVRLLVDAGAEVGLEKSTPYFSALHAAASFGHTSIVAMLISTGVDVNLNTGKPFLLISNTGKVFELNLENGKAFDSDHTALGVASSRGFDKVVKLLIEAGADGDSKNVALHLASRKGYHEVVKLLLGAGANLNQRWELASPLREAVANCHRTTVKILLDTGADVNLGGSWNRGSFKDKIPLEEALEMLELLAAAGAEILGREEMMKELEDETKSKDETESQFETDSEGETKSEDETGPGNETELIDELP